MLSIKQNFIIFAIILTIISSASAGKYEDEKAKAFASGDQVRIALYTIQRNHNRLPVESKDGKTVDMDEGNNTSDLYQPRGKYELKSALEFRVLI